MKCIKMTRGLTRPMSQSGASLSLPNGVRLNAAAECRASAVSGCLDYEKPAEKDDCF